MLWIVLPTRNEAAIIRENLERVLAFLRSRVREDWHVIVADNGSTDATRAIVREVTHAEPRVELLELPEAGKGGAVLIAWQQSITVAAGGDGAGIDAIRSAGLRNGGSGRGDSSDRAPQGSASPEGRGAREAGLARSQGSPTARDSCDVSIFMDADLATDLRHLPDLIAAVRGGADIAVGSRYLPNSHMERGLLRRLTSWCYRTLLRVLFGLRVSDPPCGFKAVNARVIQEIVPLIRDRQWFFDTELCIRAQRAGLRIAEIPVTWNEPRSRRGGSLNKVLRITLADLRAMRQLARELRTT